MNLTDIHKRPHNACFHLHKTSKIGKSIETQSGQDRSGKRVNAKRFGEIPKLDSGDKYTILNILKATKLYILKFVVVGFELRVWSTRQVCYHLSHVPSPFCFSLFLRYSLMLLPRVNLRPWSSYLHSHAAGITGERTTTSALNYIFFIFCSIRIWTQGFTLARQALCHLSHIPSPKLYIF
jgi:hypothetical protein